MTDFLLGILVLVNLPKIIAFTLFIVVIAAIILFLGRCYGAVFVSSICDKLGEHKTQAIKAGLVFLVIIVSMYFVRNYFGHY